MQESLNQRNLESGDLIVALKDMRAWESQDKRGSNGSYILKGQQALVISTWLVGHHLRIQVLREQRILIFSNKEHVVSSNWNIVKFHNHDSTSAD